MSVCGRYPAVTRRGNVAQRQGPDSGQKNAGNLEGWAKGVTNQTVTAPGRDKARWAGGGGRGAAGAAVLAVAAGRVGLHRVRGAVWPNQSPNNV